MAATTTTRLLLTKPDPNPVTGDFVDVNVLNADFDKIDAAIGAFPCTSGTRPTGADRWDGRLIRETDTQRVLVWNATQAQWDLVADPAARLTLTARKTAEPTNLTTVVLADPQLRFTISSAQLGRYMVTGQLWYNTSATADFKCQFTHSAAFGMRWNTINTPSLADTSKPDFGMVFDNAVKSVGGVGGLAQLGIAGMVNITAAGTFIFNWAQNTVDAAGNTFVCLESYLRLEPVA